MIYQLADSDVVFKHFKHVLKYVNKHPNCSIHISGKNFGAVLYREGEFILTSHLTAKQRKFLSQNYKTHKCFFSGLGKYQERLRRKEFKNKWLRMTEEQRQSYKNRWIRKQQRYQSEWGGIPTSVSILESRFKSILRNCNIGA